MSRSHCCAHFRACPLSAPALTSGRAGNKSRKDRALSSPRAAAETGRAPPRQDAGTAAKAPKQGLQTGLGTAHAVGLASIRNLSGLRSPLCAVEGRQNKVPARVRARRNVTAVRSSGSTSGQS